MEVLKYCKMQIGLLFVFLFVSYLFIKDGGKLREKTKGASCNHYFDALFILGEAALILDGTTSYMVNHLNQIPDMVNRMTHLGFLLAYQWFIFVLFMYWASVTDSSPKRIWSKLACYAPVTISSLTTIIGIPKLYYALGVYTNHSKGIPVYACFLAIGFYSIATIVLVVIKANYIRKGRKTAFIMALLPVIGILAVEVLFEESLVSGIAITLVMLSIYLCMENPTVKYLELYHNEMVMGFATLVENKDGNTGGHIQRSSSYAVLIAEQLRKTPKYSKHITTDYIECLKKAAPMHDIGKISIPDDILQKPGKLTDEEFEVMKTHPEIGGKIVKDTFGHLDDKDYEHMAYKVAMYHHEKWNGKGYPKGLKEYEIPLCARIMAVADVFDAVSAKRCYRDALPLEVCYKIIQDGRGIDFDPDIVDAFFSRQTDVEMIYATVENH